MKYKWTSANDWLEEKLENLIEEAEGRNKDAVIQKLLEYLYPLISCADKDTLFHLFGNEMDADGYFDVQEGEIVIVCGAEKEDKALIEKITGLKIYEAWFSSMGGNWKYLTKGNHSREVLESLEAVFTDYDGDEEAYFEEAYFGQA
jgi:hypothetical protein